MDTVIDPITMKKLILTKQLYQSGILQASRHVNIINNILAVITFDLSIETSIKTVTSYLDTSRSPSDNFQGLVQQADNLLNKIGKDELPDKANIQHIHSLRNDAQHKVKYPNSDELNDCRTYTKDFLKKLFLQVWLIDFDTISLSDAIQNSKIKQYLISAEEYLARGDLENAIDQAAIGFFFAIRHGGGKVIEQFPSSGRELVILGSFDKQIGASESTTAYDALKKIREIVLFDLCGISFLDYLQYKKIIGLPIILGSGEVIFQGKRDLSLQNAEFVVPFCIDSIIKLESITGEINF